MCWPIPANGRYHVRPPRRSRASRTSTESPGFAQVAGRGEAGDPTADHDHVTSTRSRTSMPPTLDCGVRDLRVAPGHVDASPPGELGEELGRVVVRLGIDEAGLGAPVAREQLRADGRADAGHPAGSLLAPVERVTDVVDPAHGPRRATRRPRR